MKHMPEIRPNAAVRMFELSWADGPGSVSHVAQASTGTVGPPLGIRHLQQRPVNPEQFHNGLRTRAAKPGYPSTDPVMAGGAVG